MPSTYHTILTPLDGSTRSEGALPVATRLALKTEGRLVLVQAIGEPKPHAADPVRKQFHDASTAKEYLERVSLPISEQGILVTRSVVSHDAAAGILAEARCQKADIIVMTTRGRSGAGRWLFGSVAEAVLARTTVPIWLVRTESNATTAIFDQAAPRILVPLDGSRMSEAALPHAKALAQVLHATLTLVHVVIPSTLTTDLELSQGEPGVGGPIYGAFEAQMYLEDWVERLRIEGIRANTAVRDGPPAREILAACAETDAGLVVMATHGRTGMKRVIMGSVAMDVLRQGKLPVIVVRPAMLDAQPAVSETAVTAGE
ncbi:MAG: universal stress protein [Anaerolineae bacterium]